MADQEKPVRVTAFSKMENATVAVSPDNKLQVEFRINDLIKKLVPGGALSSSCGGCGGCMGCGHLV
jgi:hypothetical protein